MQAGELEQPLNPGATAAATSASIASSTAMATTSTGLPATSAAANAAGAASNAGPGAPGNGTQFPLAVVGDSAQNAFPAVTSQQALFTDRADSQNALGALAGSSTHLFLTTDDAAQQAAQAAQPQQQVSPEQLRPRKAAFGQGQDGIQDRPANTTMQPPHLAPANRPEDEEFLRRQQQLQQEQDRAAQSQPMQQAQNAAFSQQQASRTQTVQAAGQFSQSQQQAQQQQQQREVQQNAASAIRPPGNAVPGAAEDAFNATQIGSTTVPAVQFGFEDPQTVRNRQSGQNVSQHPAAVLGFADGYMQQDGTTDARAQGREFSAQFQVNPSAMVASGMAYDMAKQEIDAAKGMATGVPHDPSMATPGMDPGLQMAGRTVPKTEGDMRSAAAAAAAAAAHPYVAGTVEKRVVCNVCGSLFGDAGSLKRHAARAHRAATGKGPVFCTHCSASLKNEQNLRRHVAVCHSGDQENRCDMCSASFSSRGSLRIHQQQVHAVPGQSKGANARNGRPGMPNRAGAPAARGTGRPRGGGIQKSSKSEKSYVCDMCSDTFKWKGNLKRHRELRHLQLRPFTCQVCQARFGTKSNMRVHLITHNNTSAAQK